MEDISQKVRTFFSAYPQRTFNKRELLIRAGEDVHHIFYITTGRVSQYAITPTGSEIVVNVFKPGAFLPMSSAINHMPSAYFFEASEKTVTHSAPAEDVVQFLQENPDVTFNLLSRVYRGTDGLLRRMAHLMGGSAKTRLLFELLNATYRFGTEQPDGTIVIELNETDLGKHSGLARETVSRTMQKLKDANLVEVKSQNIIVKNLAALEAMLSDGL